MSGKQRLRQESNGIKVSGLARYSSLLSSVFLSAFALDSSFWRPGLNVREYQVLESPGSFTVSLIKSQDSDTSGCEQRGLFRKRDLSSRISPSHSENSGQQYIVLLKYNKYLYISAPCFLHAYLNSNTVLHNSSPAHHLTLPPNPTMTTPTPDLSPPTTRAPIPTPQPAYLATAGSPLTVDKTLYTRIQQSPRHPLQSFTLPPRSGRAWLCPAQSIVRISTPDGPQVGDLNIWNANSNQTLPLSPMYSPFPD